ncbi:hypothetical protein [uncultured Bradyrhizobium sp.]|jgi:hypothetical protein|uniref:hypothetical protein n=1 Tax=uncultured Bradyrhizobium sp. TaxID=199684 RepID=UPI00262AD50F|nr:hypothetical protein [uncultured Bradyrhizobium sp.]
MPTDLIRASTLPANRRSSARNFNVVAVVLTVSLVILQLVGLAILERSHAHAMHVSLPSEAAVCPEGVNVDVPQIPYD